MLGRKRAWGRAVAAKRGAYLSAICGLLLVVSAVAANAGELKCEVPFAKDSDRKRLASTFGQSNVARETVYVEGDAFPASIVFPNDPNRRLEILWWNEKARRQPSSIQADGAGWFGPKGIRVGMTLSEVEALNGGPFYASGFQVGLRRASFGLEGRRPHQASGRLPIDCFLFRARKR